MGKSVAKEALIACQQKASTFFLKLLIEVIFSFCTSTDNKSSIESVQVLVRLHIFPIFSFLEKMLSSLSRNDNIFARNENIGKNMQADHNLNGF